MLRVLVTDRIEKSAADKLIKKDFEVVENYYDEEELKSQIKNFDVLVVRSATKVKREVIDAALETGRLKLIVRGGVGLDNIDASYAKSNGIKVFNTPNASTISVAELTMAHILALSRYLYLSNVTMREGKWAKKEYEGVELYGKTLGLVGFGRIAKEVARRARAFGMDIMYTDVLGKSSSFEDCEYCTFEKLLSKSDFISLHMPFDKSKGFIMDREHINMMRDGAYLINCARGGLVDEKALLEALNSGKLSGAAIDVFEEEPSKNMELIKHPKVSVTPHIGASTAEAQKRIGEEIVRIIVDFFK